MSAVPHPRLSGLSPRPFATSLLGDRSTRLRGRGFRPGRKTLAPSLQSAQPPTSNLLRIYRLCKYASRKTFAFKRLCNKQGEGGTPLPNSHAFNGIGTSQEKLRTQERTCT